MLRRALLVLCFSIPSIGCGIATDFSGLTGPAATDGDPSEQSADTASGDPSSDPSSGESGSSGRASRASNGATEVTGGGKANEAPKASLTCETAGPFVPSTAANATHQAGPWFGVGQSVAADATFHAELILQNASDELLLTNFHASLPPQAKVVGIRVLVIKSAQAGDSTDKIVSLSSKGALVGASRAMHSPWPTAGRPFSYGSPTDTWGTTLTAADVNDPSFGVALILNAGLRTNTAQVSTVTMTIDYCY
jgi:hypothetical protein